MANVDNEVKISELFPTIPDILKGLFEGIDYPWEALKSLKSYIAKLIENGLDGFTEISEGVYVGKNVTISPFATINPPAIICDNCEIRPGAYIRGDVIVCEGTVVGNSTELKHSVLVNNVQAPHYNYIGDSILGAYSHTGAGVICSNLKLDKKNIVIRGKNTYETGMRKIGAILGEHAEVGCNSVLNPGTIVGANSIVYTLCEVRGIVPANSIRKHDGTIVVRK